MKRLPQRMLIAFVGPNLTGKTQAAKKLAQEIEKRTGRKVKIYRLYREGEKQKGEAWLEGFKDPVEKIFYYAKLFHRMRRKIESALAAGYVVIAERYIDDAIVGMSTGDIASQEDVKKMLLQLVFGGIKPNITFLLKVSAHVAKRRLAERPMPEVTENDRKHIGFHDTVLETYEKVALETDAIEITSEGTVDETAAKMLNILEI